MADTLLATVKAFCTDRSSQASKGLVNESLFNTINTSVLFTVFDGAPYVQATGLILCREHFKNALASEKDNFHDFLRIVDEAGKKDSDFAKIRCELFSKQHSIIKDLHYAPTTKQDWLQWQKTILETQGHQSGSGLQKVHEIIRYMPYAPTRAGVEGDCYEVLCRTMKATMNTMADKVKQGTAKDVREAYKKALDTMQTKEWLRLGLNADKKIMERPTLRRLDRSASFQPTKTRHFEDHMRTMHTMVHEGELVSNLNTGTMIRVVLDLWLECLSVIRRILAGHIAP